MKFEFEGPGFVKRKRIRGDINKAIEIKKKSMEMPTFDARKDIEALFDKKDSAKDKETSEKPKISEKRISDTIIRRKVA